MIFDGIENVVLYLNNFDPEKSDKPFAYITKIIYYAFLRRIAKEKKQLYIKYKIAVNHGITNGNISVGSESDGNQFEAYDNIVRYVEEYELKQAAKQDKKKEKMKLKKGLEVFAVDDEEIIVEDDIDIGDVLLDDAE